MRLEQATPENHRITDNWNILCDSVWRLIAVASAKAKPLPISKTGWINSKEWKFNSKGTPRHDLTPTRIYVYRWRHLVALVSSLVGAMPDLSFVFVATPCSSAFPCSCFAVRVLVVSCQIPVFCGGREYYFPVLRHYTRFCYVACFCSCDMLFTLHLEVLAEDLFSFNGVLSKLSFGLLDFPRLAVSAFTFHGRVCFIALPLSSFACFFPPQASRLLLDDLL